MTAQFTQSAFLVGLQRLEFQRAARLDTAQLILQLALSVLSVAAIVAPSSAFDPLLAIGLFLIVGATFALLVRSRHHRGLGDKARRASLIVDGLGTRLSPSEIRRLASLSATPLEEVRKYDDPSFFATTEPQGVPKAVAMLAESAFWSSNLFAASAQRLTFLMVASGVSLLLCLLVSLSLWPLASSALVRTFCSVGSSIVFLEAANRIHQYRIAVRSTEEVLDRLDRIQGTGNSKDDFFLALVDYNSAVEGAPMMAPGVYKANHARLDKLWRSRVE